MKAYKIGDLVSVDLDSMCLPPFGTLGLVVGVVEYPDETCYTIRFNDREENFVRHDDLVKV